MSAASSEAPSSVELGDGFIYVRRPDGQAAIFAPHVQSAGVAAMMTPSGVNARNVDELRAWLSHWGFEAQAMVHVNQMHGTSVVEIGPRGNASGDEATADADGMWSSSAAVVLAVKAADCAPVWVADIASQRFALVHAGWRGVADGIIVSALKALSARGTSVEELTVAVGPHLRPCCFEVGPEVARRFAHVAGAVLPADRLKSARQRTDSVALDLSAAIRASLIGAGVRDEQVFAATACTRCHPELFHSYRRNGSGGPLMAAVAARRG